MQKHLMGAVLLVLGVALLLVGANTQGWWTTSEQGSSIGLGLRAAEICTGRCESLDYTRFMTASDSTFAISGNIAFYGAFVITALAVLALAFSFAGSQKTRAVSPARITGIFGAVLLIVAIIFVFSLPGDMKATAGYSMFLFLIGGLASAIGGAMLSVSGPAVSPPAAQLGPAGPAGPARVGPASVTSVPACPNCRAPMEWVGEHSRFFCKRCSVYV